MALCALLAFIFESVGFAARPVDDGSIATMLLCAGLSAAAGAGVWLWGKDAPADPFNRKQAVFTVNFIWMGICTLGALPYMLDAGLSFPDAFFETSSGFTTTGATIVADIEGTLSHPLLLWRSLTQWLGGMGIVVLFVAISPHLGVSGKHMYRSEVPGVTAEGLQPRIAETSMVLWRLYLAFTIAEIVVLYLLGMDSFDSLNHAWTTMSTGGFSTRNDSVAAFNSGPIEVALSAFMLIAGVNFGLYYAVMRTRNLASILRSIELRTYGILVVISTLILGMAIVPNHDGDWIESLRTALFMVATTITSTGFGVDDYMGYSPGGLLIIVGLMFIGGCAGSTAGGIKVSRIIILTETAWAMLRRSVRPNVVQVIRVDKKVLDDDLLLEVSTFFFLYMACMAGGTVIVSMTDGVSLPTALGAMLTSLSNMGPAPFYEGADNFSSYSGTAKLMFGLAMILGRLEFVTVMVLLLPDLWRR